MKDFMLRIWSDEQGIITMEWILLMTGLTVGITGAFSGVRDGLISEIGDVAEAMVALDQSYYISWPWEVCTPEGVNTEPVWDGGSNSCYIDQASTAGLRVKEDGSREERGVKPSQRKDGIEII